MKLKKWIVAGSAILVAAGAAPWGVGYLTEQQWFEAAREVNRSQPFLTMETEQYQRGVLGADARGTLTLTDPATGDRHQVDFRMTVSHGVTGSLMDFRPADGWQPEGANWFPEGDPRLTLETRLWGAAVLELKMPVIRIEPPEGNESLRSSGGLVRLDVGSMGEQADLLMVWPELQVDGPDGQVGIRDIQLEQSMEWLSGDIWTGSGTMTVQSLSFAAAGAPPVTVEGVTLDSLSEASDDGTRLDSEVSLSLDSTRMMGDAYGPHRVTVSLEQLDVDSWNDFSNTVAEMQALALQDPDDPQAAFEQQMVLMQRVNDSLQGLVAAGFSAGIPELSVSTPEGVVEGSLSLSHPELSEEERQQMLMVMQRLTGQVDLSLPAALAENYPSVRMQAAPLIKQGLLVEEGDRLVLEGRMKDMVLTINGQDLPLPPLF